VRHGESYTNTGGKFISSTDLPLTKKGVAQALAAKEHLKDIVFDRIFSSPLLRAIQTAEIICEDREKVESCEDLKEMLFGDLEGLTWEERYNRYSDIELERELSNAKIPNGESFDDVVLRCNAFIKEKLAPRGDGENILVASHGITLRVLINCLLKKPNEYVNYIDWADNTAIAEIDLPAKKIIRLNDRKHLTDLGLGNSNYGEWGAFSQKDYMKL